jgi:transcriptional repressor NrdR
MRCPRCQFDDSRVIDSRVSGDSIRRRRECLAEGCGERFTTHERMEARVPWIVKKDGRREPFDRDKVLRGVALACRKRPLDAAAMDDVVRRVEAQLEMREGAIPAALVGQAVMDVLRDVDEVAYVRFASVYREFESVEQFIDTVRPLREQQRGPGESAADGPAEEPSVVGD